VYRAPNENVPLENTRVFFRRDGTLKKGSLSAAFPQTIQGYPVSKYSVITYHKNGAIKKFRLSKDHQIGTWILAARSLLELDSDGRPLSGTLSSVANFSGMTIPKGALVKWNGEGGIRSINAPVEMEVGKVLLAKSQNKVDTIMLYGNGRLMSGRIAQDAIVDGVFLKRGSSIFLDVNGRLNRSTPPDDHWIASNVPLGVVVGPKPVEPILMWSKEDCEQFKKSGEKLIFGSSMGAVVPDCPE